MRAFTTGSAADRRRTGPGLHCLVISGLLWGTGGLTGSQLGRVGGLSAIAVAACRLTAGGVLIVAFLTVTGRRWPAGRAAWGRITVIGLLAAFYQSCYFTAVSLTSVPLATLVTIGAAPVMVLAADRVSGRRPGRGALVRTGLAVTGLGLLLGLPSGFPETAVLASAGMAALAAAGFAAVTLTGSRPVPGLDDLTVTGFGFTGGGLLLMPLAQLAGGVGFRPGLAAIGLLVGSILAALLLGERLSAAGIAGAAIIGTAVILTVQASPVHASPVQAGRGHPEGVPAQAASRADRGSPRGIPG